MIVTVAGSDYTFDVRDRAAALDYYNRNGFVVLREVFSAALIDELDRACSDAAAAAALPLRHQPREGFDPSNGTPVERVHHLLHVRTSCLR